MLIHLALDVGEFQLLNFNWKTLGTHWRGDWASHRAGLGTVETEISALLEYDYRSSTL